MSLDLKVVCVSIMKNTGEAWTYEEMSVHGFTNKYFTVFAYVFKCVCMCFSVCICVSKLQKRRTRTSVGLLIDACPCMK